jgi:hypothetical protein
MKSVVALMLFVTSVAAFAEVKVETDRFTGDTTYSTPLIAPQSNALNPFAVIFVSDGKMPGFGLVMTGMFRHWKYIDCANNIHWLLDGKPVQFPPAKHAGKLMGSGYVLDGVFYSGLPIEKLKAIASASVVEYKICGDEYKFDETTLSNFRELLSKFATAK